MIYLENFKKFNIILILIGHFYIWISYTFQTYMDFAFPWQKGFQDPATPIMEGIIDLHHYIFFYLLVILIFVSYLLFTILVRFYLSKFYGLGHKPFTPGYFLSFKRPELFLSKHVPQSVYNLYLDRGNSKIQHSSLLEIIWTILPTIVLICIAGPSFILLYSIDEVYPDSIGITIKVIGHQWYWSYEITDLQTGKFISNPLLFESDSYMKAEEDLEIGELRLLEVDKSLVVPIHTVLRFLVTSTDVLHSWAVPSLGVKIDAVPGRINQTSAYIKREGTYYGQCSEICGVYHGFMPIKIEAIDPYFVNFIKNI